jgi:eukaryotic-like serine/threonine-protein kinase
MSEVHDSVVERSEQRLGATLKEKWRLDAVLGVGGMATVYSATHRNGKHVAVKILHTELSLDAEIRQRFLREGYAANKVEHPGAVSVLDDDVAEDGTVFLVMDLLKGESLSERVERCGGTLEAGEALVIGEQLLDVLAAAHERGIVHRDIKPDNIFITREGAVKILDFGIARLREMGRPSGSTQTGLAMGTPAFMPPEQARGRWDQVGPHSDVWAAGATLFYVITGRPVHVAETTNELLLAAMTVPPPKLETVVPGLPQAVYDVVDRALAYEPNERWADARAMQGAIVAGYEALRGAPILTAPRVAAPSRLSAPSTPTVSAPKPLPQLTTARGVTGMATTALAAPPRTSWRSTVIAFLLALTLGGVVYAWVTGRTPREVAIAAQTWVREKTKGAVDVTAGTGAPAGTSSADPGAASAVPVEPPPSTSASPPLASASASAPPAVPGARPPLPAKTATAIAKQPPPPRPPPAKPVPVKRTKGH